MAKEKTSPQEDKQHGTKLHLILFSIRKGMFAVPIAQVKEVVLTPAITQIPQSPESILGVANVRGDILAMVDSVHKVSGKDHLDIEKQTFTLVLESQTHKVGFVIEEMPGTIVVDDSALEEPPTLEEKTSSTKYITNIFHHNGKLIILVDLFQLVNAEDLSQVLPVVNEHS